MHLGLYTVYDDNRNHLRGLLAMTTTIEPKDIVAATCVCIGPGEFVYDEQIIKPRGGYVDHIVPQMEHPYAKHWKQPDRADVSIDSQWAYMTQATFDKLADYSCSQPSGVYPGKMWKSSNAYYRKIERGEPLLWWLKWFGNAFDRETGKPCPEMCANHCRPIMILP